MQKYNHVHSFLVANTEIFQKTIINKIFSSRKTFFTHTLQIFFLAGAQVSSALLGYTSVPSFFHARCYEVWLYSYFLSFDRCLLSSFSFLFSADKRAYGFSAALLIKDYYKMLLVATTNGDQIPMESTIC